MSLRFPALLPRAAVLVLAGVAATATLSYAAGRNITATTPAQATTTAPQGTVLVPDVRGQAFVFAKGALEDAGFAWHVGGSVHGYSANTVAEQSPPPGTKLLDTGSPVVTLTLKRTPGYQELGAAEDASPYAGTPDERADLATRVAAAPKPAATTTTTAAATTAAAATTPAAPKRAPAKRAATPAARPPAFVVPGARTEPLDEMPLTARAHALDTWLAKHPKSTNANVKYWLYQHQWIVTGAKLGWWHGAQALQTLIAVDEHAQSQWGFGAKSKAAAVAALGYVEARSKK
jgi:PASTA domain-containing protein